ncbi:MAG: hypothetical protein ACK55Z_11450, partial [bacterium]
IRKGTAQLAKAVIEFDPQQNQLNSRNSLPERDSSSYCTGNSLYGTKTYIAEIPSIWNQQLHSRESLPGTQKLHKRH